MYQKNLNSVVEYLNSYDFNNEPLILQVSNISLAFKNTIELQMLIKAFRDAKDWNFRNMYMSIVSFGYIDIAEYDNDEECWRLLV